MDLPDFLCIGEAERVEAALQYENGETAVEGVGTWKDLMLNKYAGPDLSSILSAFCNDAAVITVFIQI